MLQAQLRLAADDFHAALILAQTVLKPLLFGGAFRQKLGGLGFGLGEVIGGCGLLRGLYHGAQGIKMPSCCGGLRLGPVILLPLALGLQPEVQHFLRLLQAAQGVPLFPGHHQPHLQVAADLLIGFQGFTVGNHVLLVVRDGGRPVLPVGGAVLFHDGQGLFPGGGSVDDAPDEGKQPHASGDDGEHIGGQMGQSPRRQQADDSDDREDQGRSGLGKQRQLPGILPGHGPGRFRGQPGEGVGQLRLLGLRGGAPLFGADGAPLLPEGPQLPNLTLHFRLRWQGGAGFFQNPQHLLRASHGFPGLGDLIQAGFHFRVGQRLLVIVKLPQPILDLVKAHFQLLTLGVQVFQLCQLLLDGIPLGFRLGKQAAAVIAAAVFQVFQAGCQPVGGAAVVAGGDEGVETAAQGLVLGDRQVGKADESRPAEHRLFHAQQHRTAVCRRQLLHRQAGDGLVGFELPQGYPVAGGALDGDVTTLPV